MFFKNVPVLNHWLCRQVAECLAQGYYQKDKNNARLCCCNGCWGKIWLPVFSSTLTVAAQGTVMTKHTHIYAHACMGHSWHHTLYACTHPHTLMGPDKRLFLFFFKQENELKIKMEPVWTSDIHRDIDAPFLSLHHKHLSKSHLLN